MAKFATGFLLGAVIGTGYALLTAKKSGPQRQAHAAAYVDSLTQATNNVQSAVKRFGNAMADLRHELDDTLQPAMADIQSSVNDFEFQTKPHVNALNNSLEKLGQAAQTLDDQAE
ncbi:YtxH domain-containing protein [Lacticaseibacillus sp. GG6-2]